MAFGAGVASGAPLRTGREECHEDEPVAETSHCAGLARSAERTPEAQAARLCCALNCQGGAGGNASASRVPSPRPVPAHPAAHAPAAAPVLPREHRRSKAAQANESPPVYLLKLTLLI